MRRNRTLFQAALCAVSATALAFAQHMQRMNLKDFRVTEGRVAETSDGTLLIEDAKTRAVLGRETRPGAEITFRYLGPTRKQSALGSGMVRTQIGLKLRAQDGCNLVYVMWRILPESRVVVSIKSNPGEHTAEECGNRGYHNVRGSGESRASAVELESRHSLRAELEGDSLVAWADGKVVWEGRLDASAFAFDGPLGFRTDNGRFEIEFQAASLNDHFAWPGRTGPE